VRKFLDKTFKHDNVNAIYQGLEKAEADESLSAEVKAWAKEQKAFMDVRSPTGMAVALEGYRRAAGAKRLDVVLQGGELFSALDRISLISQTWPWPRATL